MPDMVNAWHGPTCPAPFFPPTRTTLQYSTYSETSQMDPISKYHPQAVEDLHKTCSSSKTNLDVASDPRIQEQKHAADRAYLWAGIHKDGGHRHKMQGFHPMFHALRDSTKTHSDRKGWIQATRNDMWDAVCAFSVIELP